MLATTKCTGCKNLQEDKCSLDIPTFTLNNNISTDGYCHRKNNEDLKTIAIVLDRTIVSSRVANLFDEVVILSNETEHEEDAKELVKTVDVPWSIHRHNGSVDQDKYSLAINHYNTKSNWILIVREALTSISDIKYVINEIKNNISKYDKCIWIETPVGNVYAKVPYCEILGSVGKSVAEKFSGYDNKENICKRIA